jgi:hypothetical protein
MLQAAPLTIFCSQAPAESQNWPIGQGAPPTTLQPFEQVVASWHMPLEHATGVTARQLPAPSQVGAPAAIPELQLGVPQVTVWSG